MGRTQHLTSRHGEAAKEPPAASDPPAVVLFPTSSEAAAIRAFADRVRRRLVPSDVAADFCDQLFVRDRLIEFAGNRVFGSLAERLAWIGHADKIIEAAGRGGIAHASSWLDRPEAELDERLAPLRETPA